MVITLTTLARTRPDGGATAIYEYANALCRRGNSVHLMHVGLNESIESLRDVGWMSFEEGIEHIFPSTWVAPALPEADFINHYDERIPLSCGLPFVFVQGYRTFFPQVEDALFGTPCPKVCVAEWLIDVAKEKDVPADQVVHVPNGLRHDKYRLVSPIESRSLLMSTRYRSHRQTRPGVILAVLAEVKRQVPELEAILFSADEPADEIAPWIDVVIDPSQDFIVNEIYNRSRIFLCASRYEGFGFPSIEAMACGAALATTANGGSAEYAIDGETALVCEPDDVTALAGNVVRLLRDDQLRVRLAEQGGEYVRRTFDWDLSAEKLEGFLNEYAADPDRYLHR